jgi:tRNA_anti-like
MRKKYLIIAAIIWILLILAGLYFYNKPHRNAAGLQADMSLNAVDLFSQFQHNEAEANKKYMDKIIEVKGKVADVQQAGNITSIQLDGGSSTGGINCSIADADKKSPLPARGSLIAIKGRCSGFLMDVNLVDCVIEQ